MGKKKPKKQPKGPRFSLEAKIEAIAAIERGDVDADHLADALGVSTRTIRNWRTDVRDAEARVPLTKEERQKLRNLERENKKLKIENEILKKARTRSTGQRNTHRARWTDQNGEEENQAELHGGRTRRSLAEMEKRRVHERHRQSSSP